VLYQVANAMVLPHPDGVAVLRLLVEQVFEPARLERPSRSLPEQIALPRSDSVVTNQVEEAFGSCIGAVIARAHIRTDLRPSAVDAKYACDWEDVPFPPQHMASTGTVAPAPIDAEQARPPCAADSAATIPDAKAVGMTNLFRRLRRRLDRLRRYNRTARYREVREQATAILGAAAAAGCQRIAGRAARVLGRTGYVTAATLDELEQQIDTAEAMWNSCRTLV
jgi:hypothetical protein